MTLEWLIVGGGPHGVHIAACLRGLVGVGVDDLRMIDPAPGLLARWRQFTSTTGMTHLRSPSVHHLDFEPWSLRTFAQGRSKRVFASPYCRPALTLFNEHCEHVIRCHRVAETHVQARVVECRVEPSRVDVELDDGQSLSAHNLVLAIGASDQPRWPDWAPRDPRINHIFDPSLQWPSRDRAKQIAVVGGGISAVQVAMRLVAEGHQVRVISRHCIRQHQFDSDPGWLGPRYMAGFSKTTDLAERRSMIQSARHRGSTPPALARAFRRAVGRRELHFVESSVRGIDLRATSLRIALERAPTVEVEQVLLATGFEVARPGGALVDGLLASAGLPVAPCGYPVVDHALRWHPRITVAGPLAELELGPTARNIVGARRAGERLARRLGVSYRGS